MFIRCPKCGHHPLPPDQALPVACPACSVIFAKVTQPVPLRRGPNGEARAPGELSDPGTLRSLAGLMFHVPDRVDTLRFWMRVALLVGFATWGMRLIWFDYRTGEINQSFLHGPLLVFHEAGHVLFMLFGHWVAVLGGTLGQLLMPLLLGAALLLKNRDPYGAAVGLWLLGVSLLDVAPYMFDALHPQLILLSGTTGESGGHDWIYLFRSMGLLGKSQLIGALTHKFGALLVLLGLAWAACILKLQHPRLAGDVLQEE